MNFCFVKFLKTSTIVCCMSERVWSQQYVYAAGAIRFEYVEMVQFILVGAS